MICPVCGLGNTRTLETRDRGREVRRRRVCNSCGARWTTLEYMDKVVNAEEMEVIDILYNHDEMRERYARQAKRVFEWKCHREAEVYSSLYPSYSPEQVRVSSTPDPDGKIAAAIDELEEIRAEFARELKALARRTARLDTVERIVRGLPPKYREVMVQRFYEGASREQICEAQGISEADYYRVINASIDLLTSLFPKNS